MVVEEKPDSRLEKQYLLGDNPVNRGFFWSKQLPDLFTLLGLTQTVAIAVHRDPGDRKKHFERRRWGRKAVFIIDSVTLTNISYC